MIITAHTICTSGQNTLHSTVVNEVMYNMQSEITLLQFLLVQRLCPLYQVIYFQWGEGSGEVDYIAALWRRHCMGGVGALQFHKQLRI